MQRRDEPGQALQLKFYRGCRAIAKYLGITPDAARQMLKNGELPAKKDTTGAYVLVNIDYQNFLENRIKMEADHGDLS